MSGRLVLSYSALRSASCWTRTPFSSVYGAGDDPVTGWPDWGRVQTEMTSIFVSGISKAERVHLPVLASERDKAW